MEAQLLRTRGPEPSRAVERRVLDAARRPRTPSRLFALAAVVLFAFVLFAVVRPAPTPGGSKGRLGHWSYIHKEADRISMILSADEAVMTDGVTRCRKFSAKLFPGKGAPVTIRSESGRFDSRVHRVTFEGAIRVTSDDGFEAEASAAAADLRNKTWSATINLAERYAKKTNQKPETYQPRTAITAKHGLSMETGMTFDQPTLELSCAGWTFTVAGGSGTATRPNPSIWRIVDGVVATFEDGKRVEASEAVVDNSERMLRLTATFK